MLVTGLPPTAVRHRYQDREDFFALFNDGLLHAKPATFGAKYVFKRIDPVLQVRTLFSFLESKRLSPLCFFIETPHAIDWHA